MKDFRNLGVWQRAHELVLTTYRATRSFPREERNGLTNALRCSTTAIASSIAEGCGRGTDAELARCLQNAFSSACEVDYQFLLARDLDFLDEHAHEHLDQLCAEVRRMLATQIKKLNADR
jgi:four helix bundle protein